MNPDEAPSVGAWRQYQGCLCSEIHVCDFCTSMTEAEADAYSVGGMESLEACTEYLERKVEADLRREAREALARQESGFEARRARVMGSLLAWIYRV